MVKGRPGLYLEAWKFGVYISIPIFASWYYSYPETQRYWADYWQFIKYPENPNTGVKQKIKELAEQKEKERSQRLAYQRQLQELQRAAERSEQYSSSNSQNNAIVSSKEDVGQSQPASSSSPWWKFGFGKRKQQESSA